MPTKILKFQTPLSVFQKSFSISKLSSNLPLKVFGCIAFTHIHAHNRGKLDPRARKCVFVGYSPTQKGYKCYDPISKKMFVTMDVTFFESKPFFETHLQGETHIEDIFQPKNSTLTSDGPIFINTKPSVLTNENLGPDSIELSCNLYRTSNGQTCTK